MTRGHDRDPHSRHSLGQKAAAAGLFGVLALVAIFGGKGGNNHGNGRPERAPEPKVSYLSHALPSWESGKDAQGNFTFRAKKIGPDSIVLHQNRQDGLTATENGEPIEVTIRLPRPGPGDTVSKMMTDGDLHPDPSEPSVEYKIPEGNTSGSQASRPDIMHMGTTTWTQVPAGETIQIQQVEGGGLIALHDGDPVLVNVHVPLPGQEAGN